MKNIKKIFFTVFAAFFVVFFALTGRLSAAGSGDDAGSGVDASDSYQWGVGVVVTAGTYTGDLGPGDTTDSYKISASAGETLAVTFKSTNTAKFYLYMWCQLYGEYPIARSSSSGWLGTNRDLAGYERSACMSFNCWINGTYEFKIKLLHLSTAPCHYTFSITRSTQAEGELALGDTGAGNVNSDEDTDYSLVVGGNYTGYLDSGDTIDFYKLFAVGKNHIITANITTSSNLKINAYIGSYYTKKSVYIPNNSSGQLSYITPEYASSSDYYLKIAVSSGTGTYSFSLTSEMDILCVVPYPNPFDISKNHSKITFGGSGVPYGKIRIYTFDGKLIKSLEQTGGDTELEWHPLQDDIPSGIYLYATENPDEKNMGKITIIR